MIDTLRNDPREKYQALLERDRTLDGLVYYGIRTTGIFCRPICTARKPKFENCEFFESAQQALLAGYRPCKRCHPLELPGAAAAWAKQLVEAVEQDPERRWKDADFRELGISSSTVRRQFKQKFGMTFVAYARSRRLGLAFLNIRDGKQVVEAQQKIGYHSSSGFREAFLRTFGTPPIQGGKHAVLFARWFETPLGSMMGIASNSALRLLEFTDRRGLERALERLRSVIVPGDNEILQSIEHELKQYFDGTNFEFTTPVLQSGSPFQQSVWRALQNIAAGQVRSYSQQAKAIGNAAAVRAVARANGANHLAIIVPCHRVIGANGDLTGYGGGLHRKQWLIDHERQVDAACRT